MINHPPRPTGTLDLKEFTKLCRALDVASFSSSNGSMQSVTSVIDKAWAEEESKASSRRLLIAVAAAAAVGIATPRLSKISLRRC